MANLTATPVLGTDAIRIGDNTITPRPDLAMISVATPLGGEAELASALKSGFGLDLPASTMASRSGETHALRMTPDQILLVFVHATPDANFHVQTKLKGAGYTTDQSDALARG